jgi:DNA-binding protein H-NS
MDLTTLTLPELKKLQKDLQRAIDSYAARQKAAAMAELEARAKELGFSLAESTGAAAAKGKTRAPVASRHLQPKAG